MKGCPIYPVCLFACLLACLLVPTSLHACERLQAQLDRYTNLKRGGGSAKQMNNWEVKKKDYADRYRECLRAQPKVHKAVGSSKKGKRATADFQKLRQIDSDDPITQKLLATCNFWITTYNRNPTPDNQTYRNTACRALDDATQKPLTVAINPPNQRPLKECIKPDNLLDDEVRACMAGEREPDWQ